jgi:hypothetical protein
MTKAIFFLMPAFIMMSQASVNTQGWIDGIDDPHSSAMPDLNADNSDEPENNSGFYFSVFIWRM